MLSLISNAAVNRLVWTDTNLAANKPVNSSYAVCNNQFHTITISKSALNYTMKVDTSATISGSIGSQVVSGSLYVGGSPRVSRTGLSGCIQSLTLNGKLKDLATHAQFADSKSVFVGCAG